MPAQVDAVEQHRARRSGRRTGSPAWRCVVLPAPVVPTSATVWPAGTVRSRSGSTGTPVDVREAGRGRSAARRAASASAHRVGRARARRAPPRARPESFSSAADGGLEGVVELRDLHHRLEELAQVEQERREHADGDLAVVGEVAAVEQDDGDRDVADQPDAGHEPGDQPEGDQVGRAVLVVDVVEDLLVARLAAERLHGADAVHRLDEVDDDQRDLLAGHAVALGRLLAEPVGQPAPGTGRTAARPGRA